MKPSISSRKASLLLLRLRGRRLVNLVRSTYRIGKKRAPGKRAATAKSGRSLVLLVFISIYLIAAFAGLAYNTGTSFAKNFVDPNDLHSAIALHVFWQFLGLTLVGMGSRELAQTDSDIEWLSALPAKLPPLLLGKILERSFYNFFALVMLLQFMSLQYSAGLPLQFVVGKTLVFFIPLLFASAVWQITAEYFLRAKFPPAKLRNITAVLGILGVILIISSFSISLQISAFKEIIPHIPAWLNGSLPFLIARTALGDFLNPVLDSMLALLQLGGFTALGFLTLDIVLKRGFNANSSRESRRKKSSKKSYDLGTKLRLTPLVRRELTLLRRDKQYFIQIVFLPIMMVGLNIFSSTKMLKESDSTNTAFYVTFFLSSVYMSCAAAFQALQSEGRTLWIVASLPMPLEDLLKKKLKLWIIAAYIFSSGVLIYCHEYIGLPLTAKNLVKDAAVFAGIFLYSYVALAIGVLNGGSSDDNATTRFKPSSFYYFFGLASLYVPVFFTDDLWPIFVQTILVGCVSFSLWEEARSYLPYSLDPTSSPKSEISFVHGSVGTLLFFVLQVLFSIYFADPTLSSETLLYSYLCAALVVVFLMQVFLWKKSTSDRPRWFKGFTLQQGCQGIALGVLCAALCGIYLQLSKHYEWFEILPMDSSRDLWIFGLMAVFAAPLVEEYLFRGILLQGLLKRFSQSWSIIFSALIFATVHPASSFAPVFLLGLASAYLFVKSRNLWPGIIAHGVYNLLIMIMAFISG